MGSLLSTHNALHSQNHSSLHLVMMMKESQMQDNKDHHTQEIQEEVKKDKASLEITITLDDMKEMKEAKEDQMIDMIIKIELKEETLIEEIQEEEGKTEVKKEVLKGEEENLDLTEEKAPSTLAEKLPQKKSNLSTLDHSQEWRPTTLEKLFTDLRSIQITLRSCERQSRSSESTETESVFRTWFPSRGVS